MTAKKKFEGSTTAHLQEKLQRMLKTSETSRSKDDSAQTLSHLISYLIHERSEVLELFL